MLGSRCLYQKAAEIRAVLESLLLDETHLKDYTKALLNAQIAKIAKEAYDDVYRNVQQDRTVPFKEFKEIKEEAENLLRKSLEDGTWRAKCKGRTLLRAFCGKHGLRYEHFRNVLISRLSGPPEELARIMETILDTT